MICLTLNWRMNVSKTSANYKEFTANMLPFTNKTEKNTSENTVLSFKCLWIVWADDIITSYGK